MKQITAANYDAATNEIIFPETGERIPVNFALDMEIVNREIVPLLKQLRAKCVEHHLPYVAAVVIANDSDSWRDVSAGYMPGCRTPTALRIAKFVIDTPITGLAGREEN